MMRVAHCTACNLAYHLGGSQEEIVQLRLHSKDSYECITPLCNGRMVWTSSLPEGCLVQDIPVSAFFRATMGFGWAKGAVASLERAKELLTTEKIVEVVGESTGRPERVILRKLVLENGTQLHFDSSSKGACLYYIEEKGPTCVEVLDAGDTRRNDELVEGVVEDREETRRAPETKSQEQ